MGQFAKQAPPLGAIPRRSFDLSIFVLHLRTPFGISSVSRRHWVSTNRISRLWSFLIRHPPLDASGSVDSGHPHNHVEHRCRPQYLYLCAGTGARVFLGSIRSLLFNGVPAAIQARHNFPKLYHAFVGTLTTRPKVYRRFLWGKAVENLRGTALERNPRNAVH